MQTRSAGRRGHLALVFVGVILTTIGAFLVLPLREAWKPCFEAAHYDTPNCFALQSDFAAGLEMPVWMALMAAGLIGLVLSVAVRRFRPAAGPVSRVMLVLVSGNLITDYAMVPFFNGGYVSHDSPPGAGMWTCASIAGAGLVLIGGVAAHRRALAYPAQPPTADVNSSVASQIVS